MAMTINAADYGATANDNTDDTAAINAAIQAAHAEYQKNPGAGKVTVVLTGGTFIVSGTGDKSDGAIQLLSGTALQGAGMGNTVLKVANNWVGDITGVVRTPFDEVTNNVGLFDLSIDGNRTGTAGKIDGFYTGVRPGSTQQDADIHVARVEIMNCSGYGFDPHEQTVRLTIESSVAHHNGLDGFVADYIVDGVYRNNIAYSNDRHGFNVTTSTTNLLMEGNKAYANGSAGIVVQRGSENIEWPDGVRIIGGEYYNNAREGILVNMAENVTIDGAKIYGNLRQGVKIEGGKNTTVQNSNIYNNSQEGDSAYDEINIRFDADAVTGITYYSTGTKIIGNTISSTGAINARWGVREEPTNDDGGPTGTVVSNNNITGMDSGGVSVPGQANPVSGTNGDDTLVGTANGDEMTGLLGNDSYVVNHSGDSVIEKAGEGIDTVYAYINYTLEAHVENLVLQTGAATGTGNELNNIIIGNAGANTLKGGVGADTLDGGAGADSLEGGDGNDSYYVDSAADVILEKENMGAGGIDTVYSSVSYSVLAFKEVENVTLLGSLNINATGNSGANRLIGNAGNNVLDGQGGADLMAGGLGHDAYVVDHSGDVVTEEANAGSDTVYSALGTSTLRDNLENLVLIGAAVTGNGNGLNNVIIGNALANKLIGVGGDDVFDGGGGDDTLSGGLGTDTAVYSGNRADYIISGTLTNRTISGGASGTDTLDDIEILQFADGRLIGDVWEPKPVPAPEQPIERRTGSSRSETFTGSDAKNFTKGMGGNDFIRGLGGDDSLYGGTGNDRVYGDSGNDAVYGESGNDQLYGGLGNDRVSGSSGNDRVYGQGNDDRVYGGSGNDTADGGSGNDWVVGDSGNDWVFGNAGNDTVFGGSGNDRLYGGSGGDAFVFNTRLGSASTDRAVSFDRIVDFSVTADSLWLDNAIFRKLGAGSLAAPAEINSEFFVVGSRARERDDYLIYNKTTGVLSYDADGSGARQAVEFAQLGKNLKLTFKDFLIV